MTTIVDYLEKHRQNFPEKVFVQIDSEKWTFKNIYNKVNKISLILNQFPTKSVISIMFDNSIEFIISYLGIIKSGKIVHIISPSISKSGNSIMPNPNLSTHSASFSIKSFNGSSKPASAAAIVSGP